MTRRLFLKLLAVLPFINIPMAMAAPLRAPVLSASVSGSTVMLRWTDAGNETEYRVLRGSTPTLLSPIATLPANRLTYTDTL